MNFTQRIYTPHETIAAIATPPGTGGVAIIRISGPQALPVAAKIFSRNILDVPSHTIHFGHCLSLSKEVIDEVLVLVMRAPKTFTGEDVVEIQCHGGQLIATEVLHAAIAAGARPALAGEFSFQAYYNGKMDLTQAEAIQSLVFAKSEYARQAAQALLEGRLSKKVQDFQQRITSIAAIIEAWVDFPEEDLEFASIAEVINTLQAIVNELETLVLTFHHGKMIFDGIQLAIVGSPNVGKSSLMNALLGKDRSIVSPLAGTTRDIIEDDLRIGKLHFRIIDTAGIRHTTELIEEEGILRAKRAAMSADLVFFVLDATTAVVDSALLELLTNKPVIALWNKSDIATAAALPQLPFQHVIDVSAHTGLGLDRLSQVVEQVILSGAASFNQELIITNARHKDSLAKAKEALSRVVTGLQVPVSPEFVALDIRDSLAELASLIGTDVTEDILSAIFSQFCIGK